MAPPGMSLREQGVQEMSLVAELAGVLTVSEAVAGNLLVEARELTGVLPLTLAALEAGSVSWQHARIMVDEAGGLGPVGGGGWRRIFWVRRLRFRGGVPWRGSWCRAGSGRERGGGGNGITR